MLKNTVLLTPMSPADLTKTYPSFKAELYKVSVEAFGWDEKFQHERFIKAYRPEWFFWIEDEATRVGYACFNASKKDLHLHLLIISKEFQSNGYGEQAMKLIEEIARSKNLDITLSTLKNNIGAVKFYQRLGYEIYNTDEYFYELILKTA